MSGQTRLPDAVATIPDALAFWAAATPDAPAVVPHGRPPISYDALWRSAGGLDIVGSMSCWIGRAL